ncbi:MAG: class I SAM-dependent methyltransferase [Deltaproteobacteria bacterium]|nr:class I SAM-dependent methyltransferase [Deltaproteobacteria bacterium]
MMEMIYKNKPQGDGKLGVLVDAWCLNTAAAKAVRGRRKLLSRKLGSLHRQKAASQDKIRIMNLACGSNRELFDFLSSCRSTNNIEAVCLDADPEALEYTDRYVNVFAHQAAIRYMQDDVVKWSLGRIQHNLGLHDIIYSAGLTDYLDKRLFKALAVRAYEHLKPGGVFVVGNFGTNNPNRVFMDQILHWNLIHRDEEELKDLFASTPFAGKVEVVCEEQRVNLFAVGVKGP